MQKTFPRTLYIFGQLAGFLAGLNAPSLVLADVDLLRGSFIHQETDIKLDSFILSRTYDSRSTYKGAFGFGWCGDFEVSVERISSRQVVLSQCSRTRKIKLSHRFEDSKEQVTATMTATGVRMKFGNRQKDFDKSGRLIESWSESGQRTRWLYEGRLLRGAVTGEGKQVRFEYDRNQSLITQVRLLNATSPQILSSYLYSRHLLVATKSTLEKQIQYRYDRWSNLTRIDYDDQSTELISYLNYLDLIASHTRRDHCREEFHFRTMKPNRLVTDIRTNCHRDPASQTLGDYKKSQAEFILTPTANGRFRAERKKVNELITP